MKVTDAKRDITAKKIEDIQKGEQSNVKDEHAPKGRDKAMGKDLKKIQNSR
jgi:hypothetical protein